MPVTDCELMSMEDHLPLKVEDGNLTNNPSLTPSCPVTAGPSPTTEPGIENRAVSMASNDCSSALSSPAEASPAKPAATSPTLLEQTLDTSPATSKIASAADSLKCTGTSLIDMSESPPSVLPSTSFGSTDLENINNLPTVLTFKGVSVSLESNSVWRQFYSCGTEMILTKQGRRMFPYCRYRVSGLDPERKYSLVLSIVPSDQHRYRWNVNKWEVSGPAEHQTQGLIRAFPHHYSPCTGSEWMSGMVSFYKLKLTNNSQDQDGYIILHSMHRYIPRLHVIPVLDGVAPTPDHPVIMGPESMTFTFPQTEFMAVTTYQNFRITQLKINHNPFAKGFREDGNNPRLKRISAETLVVKTDAHPPAITPAATSEKKEEVRDLWTEKHSIPKQPETRLVLKPIMSTSSNKDEPYVQCIRGKHALGELVLVEKRPCLEHKEENHTISPTPKVQQCVTVTPKATPVTPTPSLSSPKSLPGYRKRKKRINRHWANSRGREWKTVAASPTVAHSPSLTVAMQPELDDVEGLLFVSFTSKEALESHVREMPGTKKSVESPVSETTPVQLKQTVTVNPETDEEKISRSEAKLLLDLRVLKHRQVIHPLLQEVGLKLSSVDPSQSIDLQYLGVRLPLPPPEIPEQGGASDLLPGDEGLPFISRTGKTSDMTKIKGWKNKFIKSKDTSLNSDGSAKNLSAFCSNLLDEYLENEAQQISERAAAFSTNPEGSVNYQLPAKSSSYVRTLDSALKHREAAAKGPHKPCPLSYKPLLYAALKAPAPPLASPVSSPVQSESQSIQQSTTSHVQPKPVLQDSPCVPSGSNHSSSAVQKLSVSLPGINQRSAGYSGQSPGGSHKSYGLTKFDHKISEMEIGALKQGLGKTHLTPERLSVALSVLLTKEMQSSHFERVPQYPKDKASGPECSQEFCRLGCVCSSLNTLNREPVHCRRSECMLGCSCFEQNITKQKNTEETEPQRTLVNSLTNMEQDIQPCSDSASKRLWKSNISGKDPEPVFTPKSALQFVEPVKVPKRSNEKQQGGQIREEDKDPVYKYLESMMTCARVREYNSKQPPEVSRERTLLDIIMPNTATKPQKMAEKSKQCHRTTLKAGRDMKDTSAKEKKARKLIEIQSVCQWSSDRKMVLEALCERMNQNKLSRRFSVGPYRIRPVAKIIMQKPSGNMVTYRIHISKPEKVSDDDEDDDFDDSDDTDHEMDTGQSFRGDVHASEEYEQLEEPQFRVGVTPFLSGVLPAGRMRARKKPAGCQASGLIQVNGKSYNQARLMLGRMGSLHPANRLAAYVTGRLCPPKDISHKTVERKDSVHKTNTPGALHIKAAGTVVPAIITARKTTELKTATQPPVQSFQPDSWRSGPIAIPHSSQLSSTINPAQTFFSGQRSSLKSFQNSSSSSPVSLTVSPSLKTPSFLAHSGTYSFRICPPANKGTKEQKLPGVALPGGFTLIQLPKPTASGPLKQRPKAANTTNVAQAVKEPPQKPTLFNLNLEAILRGLHSDHEATGAKNLSNGRAAKSSSSPELVLGKNVPSDENDEISDKQVELNLDMGSDYLSSDSCDHSEEDDGDDDEVDIETVEEIKLKMPSDAASIFSNWKVQKSRDSSCDVPVKELNIKDGPENNLEERRAKRQKTHTVLERWRRSQQRSRFDKLQKVLKSDPRMNRVTLLTLALEEIKNLTEKSNRLEEDKRKLTEQRSVYLKEISLKSGKSEKVIMDKLKDLSEKQKQRERWMPFFSRLLQSRAAALQGIQLESKPEELPLLWENNRSTAPSLTTKEEPTSAPQPNPTLPSARDILQRIMSRAQQALQRASAETSSLGPQSDIPTASPRLQANTPADCDQSKAEAGQSQDPSVSADSPQVNPGKDGAPPVTSTPKSNTQTVSTHQPFTLPLIRSKTGRLILPSSLKPLGQGFYTLMVMKPKESEGNPSVQKQPLDADSSKNQERSISECEQPSDSDRSHIKEEDKPIHPSDSEPKCSGGTFPLAELVLLNKTIYKPSTGQQPGQQNDDGGSAVGLDKPLTNACLSFNSVPEVPEPVPSPNVLSIFRRGPGRPRKHPVIPISENRKRMIVGNGSKKFNSWKVRSQIQVKDTIEKNGVPVKRGRGRPPRKSENLMGPPAPKRREASPDGPTYTPNGKSVVSSTADASLKDANTTRPLTRGSLGKDFPSAKKRSWIDVEKELEPDMDSE
ncbi:MAX gene-associated protein isoform X2 [Sphaeramia orbicularis]|uniref:MAX gene-associated protein isoform X2 n=1 Tax=Sphaeramia orbicularis TaxID=375764 RepID=UPI001180D048|nr:MAX gene-associated protein-like isoform X2 [Sphaeramia orbicularis]